MLQSVLKLRLMTTESQAVASKLSRTAIFLVATLNEAKTA